MLKLSKWLLSLLLVLMFISLSCDKAIKYDYIIKNGRIVDGTGNPWFKADIGIIEGRIVKIGLISNNHKAVHIDASEKIVSPGFIDIHSHADGRILADPTAHNMISQGATTVIGGNCGGSKLNLAEFLKKVELQGTAINFGTLVGHGSVRRTVSR